MQRQRARRRLPAILAAIAAALGLVAGAASPAAASTAEVHGLSDDSGRIVGTVDGKTFDHKGGLFEISIDGETGTAYCVDLFTRLDGHATYTEADWDTSDIDDLATVEAILRHFYPANPDGPSDHPLVGSDAEKAMATQAAIWHVTDGFDLAGAPANSPAVVADYDAILAAVAAGLEGFGEPDLALAVVPPPQTSGEAGGLVGPYVVQTTADAVTVTASGGVTVHDAGGEPYTGDIGDGTELWLSAPGGGDGSITATATAEVLAGRVFTAPKSQTLILAEPVEIDVRAEAPVSFAAAPKTPPTSETTTTSEATTTTVPPTSETTVPPPTAPSTAPPTTVPGSGGGLPVTGAESLALAALALLLLGLGIGLRYVSRRADDTA